MLIQAFIAFLAFQAISLFQERNMVSVDENPFVNRDNQNVVNKLFVLPTTDGDEISLNVQGKKTVIYFFAPWCTICHASISNLQSLYESNEHIDVIAVALDYANVEEIHDFTNEHQLTFPVALGNESIKQVFSISAYPSYYVLDSNNEVIGRSMGYSTELGLFLRTL